MNLIEQLGGYEKAKDALELPLDYGFSDSDIEAALLDYRRQHNIFEGGDKVVHIDFVSIGEFVRYTKSKSFCFFDFGMGQLIALSKSIRHATDEEIKAGKRLDAL